MRSSARHPAPARPTAEGIIDRLDDDGAGITRLGGREVRVPLALPGERVVIEGGGRWGPARAVEILSASADRVASPCQMAGGCAGCPLIVASYQAQLEFKQQRVVRALAAYPRLSPAVLHDIWPAPAPLGYRASVKLAVGIERGKIVL
ncbi:MAG: 23S rRNA (uracil(1939)-C(5))-methyltransferase RlmD, partial [Acidobacteria bacterium]|nr:23S rRNA (uracil(1939)-C(5))-methyltransferase RlmD [Acidobacteriota bacterium]